MFKRCLLMIRKKIESIAHHLPRGRIRFRTLVCFRHHFGSIYVEPGIIFASFTYVCDVHMYDFRRQLNLSSAPTPYVVTGH